MPPIPTEGKSSSANQLFDPAPCDLRLLVLDYLSHSSYTNTARAFLADSAVKHLDADGDEVMASNDKESILNPLLEECLTVADYRREITTTILSGRIDEAIELLNQHFPAVLFESAGNLMHPSPANKLEYKPSTSVEPAHLSLSLNIHAFIEAARTIPLPFTPPRADSSPASPAATNPSAQLRSEDPNEVNVQLLHRAQNLYSQANRLPNAQDRSTFQTELSQVGGLLAYKVPERSPVAQYLTQERREATARQVESAILYRMGEPVISRLELAVRETTVTWAFLHELKVKTPPISVWPAGVTYPSHPKITIITMGTASGSNAPSASTKKPNTDSELDEILPRFDLQRYLHVAP